jgi:hypothetical protein
LAARSAAALEAALISIKVTTDAERMVGDIRLGIATAG